MKKPYSTLIGVFVVSCLAACASTPEVTPKTAAELMQESKLALDNGKIDTAVSLLESASKTNPADPAPWLKQAQVFFEADNYPAAIQAADEAMKRDPINKDAKAIAVVASLRVAIRALSDMNQDSLLRGSKRSEAERLARALRETLAQDQLIPIEEPPVAKKPSKKRSYTPRAKVSSSQPTPSAPSVEKPAAKAASNPFGALR